MYGISILCFLKIIYFLFSDGDLGAYHNVKTAYMKQKHRMIWERRHGPVGSGQKSNSEESEQ